MNFSAIPDELKARRQWVIWRSVSTATGVVTKPPFQPRAPQYGADATNPAHWGTFEEAIACQDAEGIGFVFTEHDEYFGIDIDDEAKVKPEHMEARKSFVNQLLTNFDTYAETSPSGKGLHMIGKGRLPFPGTRDTRLQVELYQEMRYFTMTGNVFGGRNIIRNQQDVLDSLKQALLQQRAKIEEGDVADTDAMRRLDLTDEEVIRLASNFNPTFAPRFNAQTGCQPGEWSDTFIAIVGFIDRFTGSVGQVRRIVLNSPMVLQAPVSGAGETRLAKAQRNFSHVLSRVRGNNSGLMALATHGRQQWENIQRTKQERAEKIVKEIMAQAEEAFSTNGVHLLKAFPLDPQYLTLTPPPGLTGEYVKAAMGACFNPYLKFALPATLSVLSGMLGRSYKLKSGAGLNVNFILAAPSATGKTQTMNVWESFMGRAVRSIGNSLSGPAQNRIINASAASIQGIFEDFMAMPSAAWFIPECASQLRRMSDPKTSSDSDLRDAYNNLYDSSKADAIFVPPRSVANRKANFEPIQNLSISTYWTTTTSKFEMVKDDAEDGFLSRVVVIRHSGPAGDIIPPWEMRPQLGDELHSHLCNLMAGAKKFDETWTMSPTEGMSLITFVNDELIAERSWAFQQVTERIKRASQKGDLPVAYTGVSRLPVTALRLAATLAVIDAPYAPSITVEHYDWAFGYLLQNLAALLSDMDKGELGATMSKDMDVVVREIKKTLRKTKEAGAKKAELFHNLRRVKPFCDDRNPGDAVRRTVTDMINVGMLTETQLTNEGRGRAATILCPTDEPIWRA